MTNGECYYSNTVVAITKLNLLVFLNVIFQDSSANKTVAQRQSKKKTERNNSSVNI